MSRRDAHLSDLLTDEEIVSVAVDGVLAASKPIRASKKP
jgi:hypothetical protein